MKHARSLLLAGLLCLPATVSTAAESTIAASHAVESESKIFTMDKVYPSMFGPKHTDALTLGSSAEREVLWITAIRADMVAADGETPESPEYFCHSVLTRTTPRAPQQSIGLGLSIERPKMFTLVQGQNEIRFPKGFGIPVFSTDRFRSLVMVMNPTHPEKPVQVGVDSRIEFVRQSEVDEKMKPLVVVPLVTKVPVESDEADHTGHHHGGDETCLEPDSHSEHAQSVDRSGLPVANPITVSPSGLQKTGHWFVPPGRHVYRHRLGKLDDMIPFDTKAHYIASHLHPFGESLELIDLTAGETVFKATAHNYPNRIAVQEITHYSSYEGLEINRHHEHEIVAVYNNTLDRDVDSMAVMYLYVHDSFRSM